jgi:dethiobiotin synthetase
LNANETVEDLARTLGAGVILVVGIRLGCLNHALLTARAIAQAGVPFCGWIANLVEPDGVCAQENVAALMQRLPAPCLGVIPHFDPCRPECGVEVLNLAVLG